MRTVPGTHSGSVRATAPLDALIGELTQAFGAKVWPNVYSTGFAAKPFDAHFDLHDVLAVQCEGEKEWLVSKLRANCPMEGPEFAPAVRQALEELDRKSTRLNSSHERLSRMPSSA